MGKVSAGDFTDVDVAFVNEEWRVALREDSRLRRSGDGIFWESPSFSTSSTLVSG